MTQTIERTYQTLTGKRNTIRLVKSDIAQVPAQAIITAINSAGMWYGGIDGVIQQNCGQQFHNQASDKSLFHLTTIVAKKQQNHRALFEDVIFVVDDLQTPLRTVIKAALQAAGEAGYTDVSLPAIRTGVMLGAVEKDAKAAVQELLVGLAEYYDETPNSGLSNITFVIYDSDEVMRLLETTKMIGQGSEK